MHSLLDTSLEIKGMKLGLERMRAFDATLGYPSRAFASVHVAGTNGKGSVSTKIASGFPGKKVGLYTSPHIHTYHERIQINKVKISEQEADRLLQHIVSRLPERPTYFELLTLLAFMYFAEQKVDLAVLEVGLGGRLDATNIVIPMLSVITSIELEHTQYLGSTLEAIAFEKGGIIKPGIPVVVGPRARYYPGAIEVRGEFPHYEAENQAIAKEALRVLGIENIDLSDVPSCRFEQHGRMIFDVGHNPAAIGRTLERFFYTFPSSKARAFVAFSSDKDIEGCFAHFRAYGVPYHYIKVDHPRTFKSPDALSFDEAFSFVQPDEMVLICGTFFMMTPALAWASCCN